VDDARDAAEPGARGDGQRQLGQHLARVTGDDGRAEDPVRPRPDMDLDEALGLAVEDGAVDVGELLTNVRTAMPRAAASRSESPTWATSGSVYVHQGKVSALVRARPRKRAFWMTMRACASELCVNLCAEHTSPAA
jgi:hypothetical protein